jgi:hypothetical protein
MLQSYSSKYNEFLTRQIHHTQRGASLPPLWSGDLIVRPQNMNARRKNRIVASSVASVCLILGSAIYILFRPTSLLMFHWADGLSLTHSVQLMRASASGLANLVPAWFVFSLPFALWVLAYLFFIEAVWAHSQSWARFLWFWSVPLIAIGAELSQITHIIPGSFDWGDLATIILAIVLGFSTTSIHNLNKGERET